LCQITLRLLERLGALSANFVFVAVLSDSIPLLHQLVVRLDPTSRREEADALRAQSGRRRSGETQARDHGGVMLHSHAHSLDLATNASASRCATRATREAAGQARGPRENIGRTPV